MGKKEDEYVSERVLKRSDNYVISTNWSADVLCRTS
jgi:hypothetical protein